MIGISDFDAVSRRYLECWNLENHDAPLLQIRARRKPAAPEPPYRRSLRERWTDTEFIVKTARQRMADTYYGGVSFPMLWPNLGPDIFGAILGCELVFGEDTSWAVHIPGALEELRLRALDTANVWYQKILAMTRDILDDAGGDYLVGVTDLHGGMDGLVSLRGPEALCLDLYENPDLVKKLNFESFELYRSVYSRLNDMIGAKQKGSTNWMGVYHPQGWYVSSCDLLGLISNDMYGEFVEPELLLEIELYGNSIFHLDGPAALRHLDSLLQIKALKGIQWVYGAGQPSAAHWLGVLQKIQAAGKMIHIEVQHGDLPALKEHLKPEGLILNTGARSVEEAREIEAYVAAWTR